MSHELGGAYLFKHNKMKQILIKEDLIGKTIKRTGYTDNTFAVFFDDNTFAIFRGCGWDERDVELMVENYNLEPDRFNCYDLKELGIITQEEYQKVWVDYKANQKIKEEKEEKIQYEKLKLKYKDC